MKQNTKKWIIIFAVCFVTFLIGDQLYRIKKYMDLTPVITPKSSVMAEIGETISIDKLADFENAQSCGIYDNIKMEGSDITDAKVSANGKYFYAGTFNCSYYLTIWATGSNHETRDAIVKVMVIVH